ncbi:acetyl-CoA C-acyltransferase [Pseudoclavibacter sp. CFCC 13796]|uniref:acetyl-CoA C-acyltransferase n=1 Tax=Pseudoclavibacter sp. CFCC 13796 TaxID=2615179 RepID=UPI001300D26B|nr:acetyl-CoA C-acyltransferase [Pseudoclavibacter sp. CFCC 13796]KAB1661451.1 acetyl-CoA C-acyltransferase [Pseudoclavibacter sp. CFCC 13796]
MTSEPQTSPDDVVIVSGARTPQGRMGGQLATLSAVDLGAAALRGAVERAGIEPDAIDHVMMGHVVQAGCGQNPARQTAVAAGVPLTSPATTINRVCLSGSSAIIEAVRLLRTGEADLVAAGGQESMTNAPHLLPGARVGYRFGDASVVDSLGADGLTDAFSGEAMGVLTERDASAAGIDRDAQDALAARSHRRADHAQRTGLLTEEIVPVHVRSRRGESEVAADEGVRPESTAETLGRLRAAFASEGAITAGNSSPISDGAAALLLTTRAQASRLGLPVLARIAGFAQIAGPDTGLLDKPALAIRLACRRAGVDVARLDVLEVNEAFAAVAIQTARLLDLPDERLNALGGAVALGHPIGASGARIVFSAAMQLRRLHDAAVGTDAGDDTHWAAIGICGGGGQGDALVLSSQ